MHKYDGESSLKKYFIVRTLKSIFQKDIFLLLLLLKYFFWWAIIKPILTFATGVHIKNLYTHIFSIDKNA